MVGQENFILIFEWRSSDLCEREMPSGKSEYMLWGGKFLRPAINQSRHIGGVCRIAVLKTLESVDHNNTGIYICGQPTSGVGNNWLLVR